MAQKGCLVVRGDAGEALGDSLYERLVRVRGAVAGLGADCVEKEMRDEHVAQLRELLARAEIDAGPLSPLRLRSRSTTSQCGAYGSDAHAGSDGWHPGGRESATFDRDTIADIQRAARRDL